MQAETMGKCLERLKSLIYKAHFEHLRIYSSNSEFVQKCPKIFERCSISEVQVLNEDINLDL